MNTGNRTNNTVTDPRRPEMPGASIAPAKLPGHWTLAKMGKRVLRPGGLELTHAILERLRISAADDVVEFAPGLGATTRLILANTPATYTGIERDPAAAGVVRELMRAATDHCVEATAQASGLADGSADVVTGEAFLTMQSQDNKEHIVREAFRVLRPGGRYGLHEMCLRPDGLAAESQAQIRDDLTRSIHVGARPLTVADWRTILEDAGFTIEYEKIVDMALLRPRRLIADEGFGRALRIVYNIASNGDARRRVSAMRSTFNTHRDQLGAVALVAIKPTDTGDGS